MVSGGFLKTLLSEREGWDPPKHLLGRITIDKYSTKIRKNQIKIFPHLEMRAHLKQPIQ